MKISFQHANNIYIYKYHDICPFMKMHKHKHTRFHQKGKIEKTEGTRKK